MEWFFFLFTTILWLFLFYLVRENSSYIRIFPFSIITLVFGVLLSSGINFPSGFTSTTVGATVTQTITYTTYNALLDPGVNNFAILWALSWGLIVFGIATLIFSFVKAYQTLIEPQKGSL